MSEIPEASNAFRALIHTFLSVRRFRRALCKAKGVKKALEEVLATWGLAMPLADEWTAFLDLLKDFCPVEDIAEPVNKSVVSRLEQTANVRIYVLSEPE
ncbi:MAG: hypothetical protein ACXADC_17035 [Candidatus Thorarchaeota archaeon]|jgi:hypothetical protein